MKTLMLITVASFFVSSFAHAVGQVGSDTPVDCAKIAQMAKEKAAAGSPNPESGAPADPANKEVK